MCLHVSEYLLASEPLIIAGQSWRYRERGPARPSHGHPLVYILPAYVEPYRVVHGTARFRIETHRE